MLTTQARPTTGEIFLGGRSVWDDLAGARRRIGVVPQHNNLNRSLTARENSYPHVDSAGLSGQLAVGVQTFPWATLGINVSGSFLLAFVLTGPGVSLWSTVTSTAIAVGFLGAYTTFSTFGYETHLDEGRADRRGRGLCGPVPHGRYRRNRPRLPRRSCSGLGQAEAHTSRWARRFPCPSSLEVVAVAQVRDVGSPCTRPPG